MKRLTFILKTIKKLPISNKDKYFTIREFCRMYKNDIHNIRSSFNMHNKSDIINTSFTWSSDKNKFAIDYCVTLNRIFHHLFNNESFSTICHPNGDENHELKEIVQKGLLKDLVNNKKVIKDGVTYSVDKNGKLMEFFPAPLPPVQSPYILDDLPF